MAPSNPAVAHPKRSEQEANSPVAWQQRYHELLRMNAALQARNEELDAFAHTVAHNLKNPLSIITGQASLLIKFCSTLPAEKRQKMLEALANNAMRLTNVIDELLLLAGVGNMEVTITPLDMAHIVAQVERRLAYRIKERQAVITRPPRWPVAMGYGPWVEEVWVNYLSNGLKYGGQPPYLELGAADRGEGMIYFWVRDNGPGLSEEAQSRLFMPFTQLGQVQTEGHGLGLSIVQRIVRKLGGQVGLRSKLGRGSLFWFTLPAAKNDGGRRTGDGGKVFSSPFVSPPSSTNGRAKTPPATEVAATSAKPAYAG